MLARRGEIAFRGRVDGQVKIRGHRIEPAEIAAALNRLPEVSTSAVIARDGELIAYVVPADDAAPHALELARDAGEPLPDYMVPARFASLAALPLTPNGKLDRRPLPDPAECADGRGSGRPRAAHPDRAAPGSRSSLTCSGGRISASDDDFFLLGGHSLLGTQSGPRRAMLSGSSSPCSICSRRRTVAEPRRRDRGLIIAKLDAMSDEDIQRMAAG